LKTFRLKAVYSLIVFSLFTYLKLRRGKVMKVAFIGMGTMGAPMALNILKTGP